MKEVILNVGKETHKVSPLLFGLFLEDINFACDGGLNSNMVINNSFDGRYIEGTYTMEDVYINKRIPKVVDDHLRYWEIKGGTISSEKDKAASDKNPWYARIKVEDSCTISNKGYNGQQNHKNDCAISIKEGHKYEISCYLRNVDFNGKIYVAVKDEQGNYLTEKISVDLKNEWEKSKGIINGLTTSYGMLEFEFNGQGSIDIDCIYLGDTDVWGKDNPKWTGGNFRKDLVETLKELNPTFLRFPGGCIVEGQYPGNEYHWKDTVGPIVDRIPNVNLWSTMTEEKGYSQSNQIGFYEYFLLCEDLCIEPLPIVWAGLNCQFRSDEYLDTESEEFCEKVIKNALDLIQYANGDASENYWAKLRAESGHPEPFNMKMIGIGNENFGSDYHKKFEKVKKIIASKYPEITCVMSSGPFPQGDEFEETWNVANEKFTDVLIDEHFYKKNEWLYNEVNRYDNYSRDGAKVFLGEYAANDLAVPHKANTFGSALAEAAFLTGIERNSDIVKLTSYAPLFCMVDGGQWEHNLIYFNGENVLKTVNYFVQQIYGTYIGESCVSFEGKLPEKVYASITSTDSKYFIKLINASDNTEMVTVNLPEANNDIASHIQLHSEDLEVANELNFTGEPIYNIVPTKNTLSIKDKTLCCELKKYSVNVYEVMRK